jgi:hypothetical protein
MGMTDIQVLHHAALLAERQRDFETAKRLRKIAKNLERCNLSNKAEA